MVAFEPIGVIHSPFREPAEAPRQPAAALGAEGEVELFPGNGYEFALSDLDTWTHIWLLYWFDRAPGWRPKVRPPRSRTRRGVFSTRSPHRPNPIGLSAVELLGVEGLRLRIKNVDALDGTPVLDIKPYVAYTDALVESGDGWLAAEQRLDPGPRWEVTFGPLAERQALFLLRSVCARREDSNRESALTGSVAPSLSPHQARGRSWLRRLQELASSVCDQRGSGRGGCPRDGLPSAGVVRRLESGARAAPHFRRRVWLPW